jgi:hypothetical protein
MALPLPLLTYLLTYLPHVQGVYFIVSPSTTAGTEVLWHTKPSSARNLKSVFCQQFNLPCSIEEPQSTTLLLEKALKLPQNI